MYVSFCYITRGIFLMNSANDDDKLIEIGTINIQK